MSLTGVQKFKVVSEDQIEILIPVEILIDDSSVGTDNQYTAHNRIGGRPDILANKYVEARGCTNSKSDEFTAPLEHAGNIAHLINLDIKWGQNFREVGKNGDTYNPANDGNNYYNICGDGDDVPGFDKNLPWLYYDWNSYEKGSKIYPYWWFVQNIGQEGIDLEVLNYQERDFSGKRFASIHLAPGQYFQQHSDKTSHPDSYGYGPQVRVLHSSFNDDSEQSIGHVRASMWIRSEYT